MAMATVSFDTLRFSRKLEESGFTHDQAVGVAEAFAETSGEALASKHDLKETVGDAVSQLRLDMRELELRLTMRMGGMAIATVAALVAIDKLI
jgi:hypothetical protein